MNQMSIYHHNKLFFLHSVDDLRTTVEYCVNSLYIYMWAQCKEEKDKKKKDSSLNLCIYSGTSLEVEKTLSSLLVEIIVSHRTSNNSNHHDQWFHWGHNTIPFINHINDDLKYSIFQQTPFHKKAIIVAAIINHTQSHHQIGPLLFPYSWRKVWTYKRKQE